ncbi:MAG: hypothetical protein ACRBK7_09330 [Acidimicrobiales bacterium]
MNKTPSVRRRSLRSTSEASLIEGSVSSRSSEPDLSVEISGGPARATVHVRVAGRRPHPLALDGSGCGRLRLHPEAGGAPVTILFDDLVILQGTTPPPSGTVG